MECHSREGGNPSQRISIVFYVYILASKKYGTLYIGVTSNLIRRVHEHRTHADTKSFTTQYNVTRLVYFEAHDSAEAAITREKQMKKWEREWKINLIEQSNPNWDDLFDSLA